MVWSMLLKGPAKVKHQQHSDQSTWVLVVAGHFHTTLKLSSTHKWRPIFVYLRYNHYSNFFHK